MLINIVDFLKCRKIRREGEPDVVEQSKVVSQLFEKDLKIISNSRENGLYYLVKKIHQLYMVTDILLQVMKEYYKHGFNGL